MASHLHELLLILFKTLIKKMRTNRRPNMTSMEGRSSCGVWKVIMRHSTINKSSRAPASVTIYSWFPSRCWNRRVEQQQQQVVEVKGSALPISWPRRSGCKNILTLLSGWEKKARHVGGGKLYQRGRFVSGKRASEQRGWARQGGSCWASGGYNRRLAVITNLTLLNAFTQKRISDQICV